jgi:hypothetical protein
MLLNRLGVCVAAQLPRLVELEFGVDGLEFVPFPRTVDMEMTSVNLLFLMVCIFPYRMKFMPENLFLRVCSWLRILGQGQQSIATKARQAHHSWITPA